MTAGTAATADAITGLLTGYTFTWTNEGELAGQLAAVLSAAGIDVRREARLGPRCRIDLLTGRVGIEVKVKGTAEDVARQLQRYAATGAVDELVLATTRAAHRDMPAELGGVPVTVAYLVHLA
ncbi:PD-(D/E)XK nuclease family protein (plasmid) [Amycolatopsis sp. FU40]|uniref:PD-(D/E)XK nuclease family protein n=1 Tax=Amycolatopsis sp. FU40 TaxID=2914159 RepID=UPI001F40A81C|nr:PD-(D/E)XK nuclease family protein [Amycolatopsis sp. FU40]UKD50880.1 PD-(D/E)XK nuclease family protein [Amycolatopsis sp. FU40]